MGVMWSESGLLAAYVVVGAWAMLMNRVLTL